MSLKVTWCHLITQNRNYDVIFFDNPKYDLEKSSLRCLKFMIIIKILHRVMRVISGHVNPEVKWPWLRHKSFIIDDLFTSSSWPQLLAVLLYNKKRRNSHCPVKLDLNCNRVWNSLNFRNTITLFKTLRINVK